VRPGGLPENVAMRALIRRAFPGARSRFDGDARQFSAPLGVAAWTVTGRDVRADLLHRGHW
jgi:hypothetical protein